MSDPQATSRRNPMNRKNTTATLSGLGLLAAVLTANYVTTNLGMAPVGFGLMATAGTYLAGLTFILRDILQDSAGKRASVAVIGAGAVLSFLVADPFIALASAVAFGVSELADLAVYTPLRERGYIRAVIASNIVGSLVDTVLFLTIAGFPVMMALPGQMAGKLLVTAGFAFAVLLYRLRRAVIAAEESAGRRVSARTVPVEATVRMSATSPIQHMCPFVQEVDNGTITVSWDTDGWTLELHSLRAYLNTFQGREISHEELTAEIEAELSGFVGIAAVTVTTTWRTAGMEVVVTTSEVSAE